MSTPPSSSPEQKPDPDLLWGPAALDAARDAAVRHQAGLAGDRQRWISANRYYYDSVKRLLRFVVERGRSVLHIRCQNGHILDALEPKRGVGVEISTEMTEVARKQRPALEFRTGFPETVRFDEQFDYVLWDQVTDAADIIPALKNLRVCCATHTRLILGSYNHLWEPIMSLAEKIGIKMPLAPQSWLSEQDQRNMLHLAGFEPLKTYRLMLFPKWIPLLSEFLNRVIARLPLINRLCMSTFIVARPAPEPRKPETVSVSVIIPCKNERGNIEPAINRIPDMGRETEIIFCDDKSTDGTADEVRRMQALHPEKNIRLVDGPAISKSRNVWTGFDAATGDVLMILDADLTVMPEELPVFFDAIVQGKGEFINGSRLVYPMQKEAMKFANMIGNKLFGILFSYLIDQRIKDTLCGTKVIWRKDWPRIKVMNGTWGTVDRWGDYELIFGATKLHLRILDLPVHYQERIYGSTKMVKVFHNGLIMLRMCGAAFKHLKIGY